MEETSIVILAVVCELQELKKEGSRGYARRSYSRPDRKV